MFKTTGYFRTVRLRSERAFILDEWIARAVLAPDHILQQTHGRVRHWVRIPEAGNRYLRVVVLSDGNTVHKAFFDRGFRP